MPGAFKLDHWQPVKLIWSQNISNFLPFILVSPILITPERGRLKMGKKEIIRQLMRHRGFSAWGIQTGPFAAILAQTISNFLLFILESPILITPEKGKLKI